MRSRVGPFLILVILLYGERTFPQTCDSGVPLTTELGIRRELDPSKTLSKSVPNQPITATATVRYQRFRLDVQGDTAGSHWLVIIRDASERAIQVFSRRDLAGSPTLWTQRIYGPNATLQLTGSRIPDSLRVRILESIEMPTGAKTPFYSWQGDHPQYHNLYPDPPPTDGSGAKPDKYPGDSYYRRIGSSVGLVSGSFGKAQWCCSGVVVGPNLFLTNWHCGAPGPHEESGHLVSIPDNGYWNAEIMRDMTIDLSWDGDQLSREYQIKRVVASDANLDFALLQIQSISGGDHAVPVPLTTTPQEGPLTIVHHPECLPKQVTRDCNLGRPNISPWRGGNTHSEFEHDCDTEAGSSGAPIFDAAGRLFGLHHLGFSRDEHCTATDSMNKGVYVKDIIEYVRRCPGCAAALAGLNLSQ